MKTEKHSIVTGWYETLPSKTSDVEREWKGPFPCIGKWVLCCMGAQNQLPLLTPYDLSELKPAFYKDICG